MTNSLAGAPLELIPHPVRGMGTAPLGLRDPSPALMITTEPGQRPGGRSTSA